MDALNLYETRSVKQRGWKVNFQINDTLKLPIEGFMHVKEVRPPSLKVMYSSNPSAKISAHTFYVTENDEFLSDEALNLTKGNIFFNYKDLFYEYI